MPFLRTLLNTQVDPAEVAKFNLLAHRFWDVNGEFSPLHALNPLRVSFIAERTHLASAQVLDVGCGGGLLCESLARTGAQVFGIDLASGMIDIARLHAISENLTIDYQVQSAAALASAKSNQFDVVTCMEMLEHIPEPSLIVQSLADLLRPGGDLFISTLNRNLRSFLMAIVGGEYISGLIPLGTHEYERMIRPSELATWARLSNLELVEIFGIEYNPITSQCSLTRDPSVNYLCHLRKPKPHA